MIHIGFDVSMADALPFAFLVVYGAFKYGWCLCEKEMLKKWKQQP